jgi:gamma-glutamyltranspeptidase
MIPNTVANVLAQFVAQAASVESAIAASRVHSEGNLELTFERESALAEREYFKEIGYQVKVGNSATAHALFFDAQTGQFRPASR